MTRQEALALAARFGSHVIIREKECTPLFAPGGARLADSVGRPLCSGSSVHGSGCPGGAPIYEVASPADQAGTQLNLVQGDSWESAFRRAGMLG